MEISSLHFLSELQVLRWDFAASYHGKNLPKRRRRKPGYEGRIAPWRTVRVGYRERLFHGEIPFRNVGPRK